MRSCMRSCKSVAYVLIMRHAQLSVHVLARPLHARLELIKVGLHSREMKRTYHAAFLWNVAQEARAVNGFAFRNTRI